MPRRTLREEDEVKRKAAWKRRYIHMPFTVTLIVLVLALGSFALTPQQVFAGCLALGFVLGCVVRARFGKGKHRDPGMQLLLFFIGIAAFGLIVVTRFNLIDKSWIFIAFLGCLGFFGVFWWNDNREHRRFEIEEELERWPDLAKKIGLEKVRRTAMLATATGRRTRLWWGEGECTLERVKSSARQLEQALKIPHNRMRFKHVYDDNGFINTSAIIVEENTSSPSLKAPVPFDRPSMRSIMDPMVIGPLEDGSDYSVRWYVRNWGGKHTLSGGRSRSGKSGLYNLVLGESAECPDLVRWGVDRKGGMTLKPWGPMFDWLVFDDAGTISMLTAVRAVLEARSNYAGEKGWEVWKVSRKRPLLLVVIDECAEVFGLSGFDAVELANSIARMGAAAGVLLLVATQHPTTEALASTQLTKNLTRRFCFSVEDSAAQRIILPNSTEKVDASAIPLSPEHSGTFYTSEGGELNLLSGRVRFLTKAKIREVVLRVGDRITDLDGLSAYTAEEATAEMEDAAYDSRRHFLIEDLPPLDADDGATYADDDDDDDEEPLPPRRPSAPVPSPGRPPLRVVNYGVPPDEAHPTDSEVTTTHGGTMPSGLSLAELAQSGTPEDRAARQREVDAWHAQHNEAQISTEEAERRMDEALRRAGTSGTSIVALSQYVGRRKSWIHKRLQELMLAGKVSKPGQGIYVWSGGGVASVVEAHSE